MDTLLARADEIKQPKRREALLNNVDQIRLSRKLVQLDENTPLDFTIDDLEVHDPVPEKLMPFPRQNGIAHPSQSGLPKILVSNAPEIKDITPITNNETIDTPSFESSR